jgi:hypothetical protein
MEVREGIGYLEGHAIAMLTNSAGGCHMLGKSEKDFHFELVTPSFTCSLGCCNGCSHFLSRAAFPESVEDPVIDALGRE